MTLHQSAPTAHWQLLLLTIYRYLANNGELQHARCAAAGAGLKQEASFTVSSVLFFLFKLHRSFLQVSEAKTSAVSCNTITASRSSVDIWMLFKRLLL
jgi:hypothetical protein